MVQKPLMKGKKSAGKGAAANRHGKVAKTKKGQYAKPPKRSSREKAKFEDDMALTKVINKRNHETFAGVAAGSGGRFKVIAAPPVAATAHEKAEKKLQQHKDRAAQQNQAEQDRLDRLAND